MKPLLAITMGDPAGVGPEITVKTLTNAGVYERARLAVVGSVDCLRVAAASLGIDVAVTAVTRLGEASGSPREIQVFEPLEVRACDIEVGKVSAACGHAAVQFFEAAVTEALAGHIEGVVTCPINKEAVHAAGYHGDIGHQEILARMTRAGLTATMLMTTGLKVAHLSTHKSLAEAVRYVRTPVLVEKLDLTIDSLRRWGLESPRIAVSSLNPHGGEGGMLGREEIEEIAPAVRALQEKGEDVVGPLPADSVFTRAIGGEFDAVLALYHDQGHIAIKVHNFEDSVTATMGIPFVRTSVDHGTAFDIAGKNLANPKSLAMAVDAAIDMMNGSLA
jgi:4-hydroxythreonine-4-phosphate dehydrogenase